MAVKGENEANITIANSDALGREKEAEDLKIAVTAEKVQAAKALEESYVAEQKAEQVRAERERSIQNANVIVPTEIAKRKAIIDAEAEAEKYACVQKVRLTPSLRKWKLRRKLCMKF